MRRLSQITLAIAAAVAPSLSVAVPTPSILTPEAAPSAGSSPAAAAIARGFKAIEAGDIAAAETSLREAIRLDPKSPGGYIGMAEVAAQRKQTLQVEPWLKKAVEVDPNGVYTLRVWGAYQYKHGRAADAEATLKKAVAADPGSIVARLGLGEVQLRGLKNAKAAEATYRSALESSPDNVMVRVALGASLAAQGRADEAVAAFEQAAKLAPSDPDPLLALARYQASRTKFDAAIAVLDRLIEAVPTAAQAYLDRGDLLLAKNDVPKAMDSYRALVKAAPAVAAPAHVRMASVYEARQQWAEAEQAYRAAIASDANFFPAYNNLAFMLAGRGQHLDEATRLAEMAVKLEPGSSTALDTLGWVQRARGDLASAKASIDRAVAIRPRDPTYHYHLGIVLAEQGKTREARASLERALELNAKFKHAEDARQRLKRLGAGG